MSKQISLTQGKIAIVDNADYDWSMQWKWYANNQRGHWYAMRFGKGSNSVYMHRAILSVPKGKITDHINHNGLDNRRRNIRICTRQQNYYNQKKLKRKTSSKYKGVDWHKAARKWHARIGHNNKRIYLGLFDNEIEAAKTYDKKAIGLFGEFAYTNFER